MLLRRLGRAGLAWAFERLYHELAWAYDFVAWMVSGGRWHEWQRSVLGNLPPGRVLEVGPGTGHLLAELIARGYDAWGLERSAEMLRVARRRLQPGGRAERLIRGDAVALPFAAACFDSVVLTFPSEYVYSQPFKDEVARVLRPGGRLVVLLGAESSEWPWPGILEWALRQIRGADSGTPAGAVALATQHEGRRPPEAAAPDAGLILSYQELAGPHGTASLLLGEKPA